MSIAIHCHDCGKNLKAPESQAGKRVRCPQCRAVLSVPHVTESSAQSSPPSRPVPTASPASRPKAATVSPPDRLWHLETDDGQRFGPVPKAELDQWVADGSVSANSTVWQDGDEEARWASDHYPSLTAVVRDIEAEAIVGRAPIKVRPPASKRSSSPFVAGRNALSKMSSRYQSTTPNVKLGIGIGLAVLGVLIMVGAMLIMNSPEVQFRRRSARFGAQGETETLVIGIVIGGILTGVGVFLAIVGGRSGRPPRSE